MLGRCALRLRQCIPFARKRGVLSRRSAAGSGLLVARHRQVHAPCEAETGNGRKRRSAKQADRHGVLGYKGARRKRLAPRNASRDQRGCEPPNMSHVDRRRMTGKSIVMQTAIFRSLALKSDYRPSGRRFGFRAGHSGVESAQDAISTISRRWKICVNSPSKSDIESEIHGIVAVREAWIT